MIEQLFEEGECQQNGHITVELVCAAVALRLKMKFCPFLFSVTCRF
jgi:hypothetical protein